MSTRFWRRIVVLAIATTILAVFGTTVSAQDATVPTMDDIAQIRIGLDTTWLLMTGMLVFFMQAGFAMLEAGLIQQRSAVNAFMENFIDAGATGLVFWAVGFGFAFGTSGGGFIGTDNFFLANAVTFGGEAGVTYANFGALNVSVLAFFFFQFAFAATASTIVTGSMAERTDFVGDLIYSVLMGALIYPIVVHWVWGGGFLSVNGFHDFAGSTVVHTVGGVTALIGAIMLGPRRGMDFNNPPKPHNMALATLGTMILWFGWYGFNPGSTLGVTGYEGLMGLTIVNTTLAASAGALASLFFGYFRSGKWDLAITLNGSLAGLVGITAGCGFVAPWASVLIGLTGGILVIIAGDIVMKSKIDDCVGAFAVHGACGIMGTIAVGLFAQPELTFAGTMAGVGGIFITGETGLLFAQIIGSLTTIVWCVITATIMFGALKMIGKLRIPTKAEEMGIDIYEHGVSAYPDILPAPGELPTESGMRGKATAPAGD